MPDFTYLLTYFNPNRDAKPRTLTPQRITLTLTLTVGTDTADYVQRVEPSAQGGRKMAAVIADAVLAERPEAGWPGENYRPRLGDHRAYSGDGAGRGCAVM
jgi:hypothetical protein